MTSGFWQRCVGWAAAVAGGVVVMSAQAPPTPVPQTVRVGINGSDGPVTIETVPLEEYVARVVSGEGQARAEPAALEALAIVVRTFALANQRRHRAEGYDLCDTTHCQVLRPALPAASAAADATSGQVLLDRGRPAFVFYSAHNGGAPALASEIWPGATDYAPSSAHDDACSDDPAWTSDVSRADVERALRATGASGSRLRGLTVVDRTASNRANRLRAEGFTPATVLAHELRLALSKLLGPHALRSTAFTVAKTAQGFRFTGSGYGHGVGLCVIGAGRRAARGETAEGIVRAYYRDLRIGPADPTWTLTRAASPAPAVGAGAAPRGTEPSPSPAPATVPAEEAAEAANADVRLVVPAEHASERAALVDFVRRTRDAVAARALVAPPPQVTITAHPSMDAFGRATGQPWWMTAATVGTTIDLAPLRELRQRGVLESTLRFEVALAVVAPYLQRAPAWVRVGAAIWFSSAETDAGSPRGRVQCPTDAELLRPTSGGAQREAFARAERCVRRAVAQGRALVSLR